MKDKSTRNIKSAEQWREFFTGCRSEFCEELRARATPAEWELVALQSQLGLSFDSNLNATISDDNVHHADLSVTTPVSLEAINDALASNNVAAFTDALGHIARERGMSRIASLTGLSRESLYRSLGPDGNPEFATIMKLMNSLGFRLKANAQ